MGNNNDAEKVVAEKKKATKNHVAVTKDGETIRVHPSQVEQHKRLGWTIKAK